MTKMSTSDLKAMLASEKADALAALSAARLAEERADAMDYYLGDMRKDMPAQDGRSRAVSTDVADTIEGEIAATVDGAPVKINGTLTTSGDPARTDYTADVAVSIPLLGGKIEKQVIGHLIDLLDSEHGHTVDWEQENRLT